MQRDAYAALIRFPHARKIPLRIRQLNGQVFHENVMDVFFTGYKTRRLALMTYTAGQDPQLPRLPRDIIIPTFEALLRVHQPHFMYQLLPLLTADVETFAVLQSICAAAGSPFSLQDRIEVRQARVRLGPMCRAREKVCDFLKDVTQPSELLVSPATRQLPISDMALQGILFREEMPSSLVASMCHPSTQRTGAKPAAGAVLVTTHEVCSEAVIAKRAIMTRLYRSPLYAELCESHALQLLVHAAPLQWHVMAVKRRVGGGHTPADIRVRAQLVQKAQQQNLLLYEKVDEGVYEYVQ